MDVGIEAGLNSAPPNSLLNKQPGEGTGPTIHVDFRGNLVGRVPSRGERDVFQQAPSLGAPASRRPVLSLPSGAATAAKMPALPAKHRGLWSQCMAQKSWEFCMNLAWE